MQYFIFKKFSNNIATTDADVAAVTNTTAFSTINNFTAASIDITNATAVKQAAAINDLESEVEALKRRLEILSLRRQIQEIEERELSPKYKSQSRLQLGDIEKSLPKFNGDDITYPVRQYLRDLEEIMEASGADQHFRLLALRRSLKGTARVFLTTTTALNYKELKETLLSEFDVGITRQEVYKMLSQRRWKKTEEPLYRYVLTMQEIGKRANISDTELIDFIIDGIGSSTPHTNILMTARSVDELKTLVNRYQHKYFAAGGTQLTQTNNQRQTVTRPTEEAKVKCFNCSRNGHIKPNCQFPIRPDGSCFRYWKMGHDHRSSPNPGKVLMKREIATVAEYEDDLADEMGVFNIPNQFDETVTGPRTAKGKPYD
ncbi:uncharacterized protein [Eurosta solidaginis]|uniref:uncharacterized protein n=1 Tax=Eurosta solidaginis TaxID=178769 RepID=UPI0035305BE0